MTAERFSGFGELPRAIMRYAEVEERVRQSRVQSQRVVVAFDRFVISPQSRQDQAQIRMRPRMGRIKIEKLAPCVRRFRPLALPLQFYCAVEGGFGGGGLRLSLRRLRRRDLIVVWPIVNDLKNHRFI